MEDQSPPSSPLLPEWPEQMCMKQMQAYCREPNIALLGNTSQKINKPAKDKENNNDMKTGNLDQLLDDEWLANNVPNGDLPELDFPDKELVSPPVPTDSLEPLFEDLADMSDTENNFTDCGAESVGVDQDVPGGDSRPQSTWSSDADSSNQPSSDESYGADSSTDPTSDESSDDPITQPSWGELSYLDSTTHSNSEVLSLPNSSEHSTSGETKVPPDSSLQSVSASSEISNQEPDSINIMLKYILMEERCRRQDECMSEPSSSGDEEGGNVETILDAVMCDSPISSLADSDNDRSVRGPEVCEGPGHLEPTHISDTQYIVAPHTEESSTSIFDNSVSDSKETINIKREDHTYSSASNDATTDYAVVKDDKANEIPGTPSIDSSNTSVRMSRVKYGHSSSRSSDEDDVEMVDLQGTDLSDNSSDDTFVKNEDLQGANVKRTLLKIVVPASKTATLVKLPPSEHDRFICVTLEPTGSDIKKKTVKKRKTEPEVTPGPSVPKKAKNSAKKKTERKEATNKRPGKPKRDRHGHYACKDCDSVFTLPGNLSRHRRQEHKEVKPDFACAICGYALKRQDYVKGHQNTKRCRAAAQKLKRQSINHIVSE